MNYKKIWSISFSPTGGTRKVVSEISRTLSFYLELPMEEIDFTKKENRKKDYEFTAEDLIVIGSPVYAGRIPNKILPEFQTCFHGKKAAAIPICVYGNRSYGDALMELNLLLKENGFEIVGAAAVVSRHAFSDRIAKGRADEKDKEEIRAFTKKVSENIMGNKRQEILKDREIGPYYTPLKEDGTPAKFLKAVPVTDLSRCNGCGICADVCPMGSISKQNFTEITGVCIKCQACIRKCPQGAKSFKDEQFLSHVKMLEEHYQKRNENFFFMGENK